MKRLFKASIFLAFLFFLWFWHATKPIDSLNTKTQKFTIKLGMSVATIANTLTDAHLIRSPLAFRIVSWYQSASQSLHAGTYLFSPSESVSSIIKILKSGQQEGVTITFSEGINVEEMDELLTKKGILQAGEFQKCAFTCDFSSFNFLPSRRPSLTERIGSDIEGYLFPETYEFNRLTVNAEEIIKRMLKEFQKRVVEGEKEELLANSIPLADIVTMASLIEKESRHKEERGIVSGIIWKRLDNHVVLGIDAVNRYGLGKRTQALTKIELEERSPYNLRRVQGLPPTPITNPGLESINAALHPTTSRYWYYLHDTSGVIRYAETDEGHIANKRKYLQ